MRVASPGQDRSNFARIFKPGRVDPPLVMSITDKINRATDEKLTGENWELIISACDAITDSDSAGMATAFKALRKRLESPAGNTQLYALTLLNALAQSGDSKVKSAIASSDTRASLEKVARTSHNTVRQRVFDIVGDLSEALGDDDFTNFAQSMKAAGHTANNSFSNSSLDSGKPAPAYEDDEEEQFQQALRLSAQEHERQQNQQQQSGTANRYQQDLGSNAEIMQKINKPMPPTPQEIRRVKTLYEFKSNTVGDLSFKPGQVITVIDSQHKDWWKGTLDGVTGVFPANYVEYIKETAPKTEEDYIFAQAPNVEKLLSIFASASQHPGYSIVGNPDIQAMYDEVLALRPQLIRLIDEYSAKKQKLMQLNGDVVEARQKYEQLVDARMAPQTPGLYQYSQEHSPDRPRPEPVAPAPQAPQDRPEGYSSHYTAPSAPSYAPQPTPTHQGSAPSQLQSHGNTTVLHHQSQFSGYNSMAPPMPQPSTPGSYSHLQPSAPPAPYASANVAPQEQSREQSREQGGTNAASTLPYPV